MGTVRSRQKIHRPYKYRPSVAGDAIKILEYVLLYAALVIGAYFLTAFLIMIAAGVVHSVWLTMMPTFGYKAALAMAWIPGVVFGAHAATSGNKS